MSTRLNHRVCIGLTAALVAFSAPAEVKLPLAPAPVPQPAQLPEDLSPDMVDSALSRLTDAEIRALLRDELVRRAEQRAAVDVAEGSAPDIVRERLSELATTVRERLARWGEAIADIGSRGPEMRERLARAEGGIWAMIAAALAVAVAGFVAALAVGLVTLAWRRWLAAPPARADYWDRVVRTLALGALEAAPVFAWRFATVSAAPMVSGSLGPMVDYVWIYEVGVFYSWGFIVIARRAFAPDAPAIRIAHLTDTAARAIYALVRRAVQIGAVGWLIAGLSPTLGLGFPPALSTVLLAGTALAAMLIVASIRGYRDIRAGIADLLSEEGEEPAAMSRLLIALAPVALPTYLGLAWLYWAALWIETGQQHLYGPAGTLVLLLALPIIDRLGLAVCSGLANPDSAARQRYRAVLHGAWRMLTGIATVFIIAGLWGVDLYGLAKGENAPPWADPIFDVAVTLLLAQFVWRVILAALHREPIVPPDDEDAAVLAPAASRLDTLVPLLRSVLLVVLAVVVTMIVLSSSGVNIGPLLASAGIVGIAVGFGAQALVRDIFSGAFFLIDDAFRVGEYIELDENLRGEVEAISMRSLQLRHHRGPVITIPFGELKHVVNHNRDWVIYKLSFRLDPDTDPDKVKRLVKDVGKELLADPEHGPKFIEPLKSQGVSMIDEDSALVIRVKFKCRPRAQFVLRREVYHRLRKVFGENDLHFARRKVEVVSTSGGDAHDAAGALPDDILTGNAGAQG